MRFRRSNEAPVEQAGAPLAERLFGRRTRLVMMATTGYVAAAGLRAAGETDGIGLRAWAASLLALGLAWGAGGPRAGAERGGWRGLAEWGLALAVASLTAPEAVGGLGSGGAWVELFGMAGAAASAMAANESMTRVAAPQGIARSRRGGLGTMLFGQVVLAVLLATGLGARAMRAAGGKGAFASEAELFGFVACTLAGAFLIGEAWDTARVRRLELGVAARMHAAAGLGATTALAAWGVWFVGASRAEPVARVTLALGAVLVCHVCRRGDPVDLARASRRAVALTVVGGPVLMLGAAIAQGRPWDGGAVVAIFGVIALAIGASAAWIEEPLRPARGAWLDAVAAAHEALLRTDPDEAVREALVALHAPAGLSAPSPELWTFDPSLVTSVDAAGYPHRGDGALPEGLVAAAAGEPESILRFEVLEAFAVRRPELRPYVRWMEHHGAMLAAVVARGGEAEGLLVLPRGKRTEAISLEEVRAIKRLADAFAALCHARASLARSHARERAAADEAEAARGALVLVKQDLARRAAQSRLAAERLARPALTGIYSAAARFAFDAIEGAVVAEQTLFVHAPGGTDAVPYIARAHLTSPRREEALVVVDGTSSREHDVARWNDPTASPIALAARGMLLLVDGGALPIAVQGLVARAHATGDPFVLVVTSRVGLEELVAAGRMDVAFAARLAGAKSAMLPRLRDRPEDLRAILSDRLAREGLRVRGSPVGIDDAAFARLLDLPFEGEDAELTAMVQRLVAECDGDVVRAPHVGKLGIVSAERLD